jgi:hypothetical protein
MVRTLFDSVNELEGEIPSPNCHRSKSENDRILRMQDSSRRRAVEGM